MNSNACVTFWAWSAVFLDMVRAASPPCASCWAQSWLKRQFSSEPQGRMSLWDAVVLEYRRDWVLVKSSSLHRNCSLSELRAGRSLKAARVFHGLAGLPIIYLNCSRLTEVFLKCRWRDRSTLSGVPCVHSVLVKGIRNEKRREIFMFKHVNSGRAAPNWGVQNSGWC